MRAVTTWNSPMPPSMSDVQHRRAPTIDVANAPLAITNAGGRGIELAEHHHYFATPVVEASNLAWAPASYFDGHFAITPFGSTANPAALSRPSHYDLGAVLERVRHHARIAGQHPRTPHS